MRQKQKKKQNEESIRNSYWNKSDIPYEEAIFSNSQGLIQSFFRHQSSNNNIFTITAPNFYRNNQIMFPLTNRLYSKIEQLDQEFLQKYLLKKFRSGKTQAKTSRKSGNNTEINTNINRGKNFKVIEDDGTFSLKSTLDLFQHFLKCQGKQHCIKIIQDGKQLNGIIKPFLNLHNRLEESQIYTLGQILSQMKKCQRFLIRIDELELERDFKSDICSFAKSQADRLLENLENDENLLKLSCEQKKGEEKKKLDVQKIKKKVNFNQISDDQELQEGKDALCKQLELLIEKSDQVLKYY